MISQPDYSTLTKQQLQEWIGSAVQDLQDSYDIDYPSAWRKAKTLYPAAFAALDRFGDDVKAQVVPPVISNDDKARIAQMTPSKDNLNRLGLHPLDTTPEEYSAAADAAGDLANPDYEAAFSALVNATASARGLTPSAASQVVGMRHMGLKRMADTQKASRELQSGQPTPGAGFQKYNKPSFMDTVVK
jgi:hypothetical protein